MPYSGSAPDIGVFEYIEGGGGTSSLLTGLVAYYKLNERTGTNANDTVNNHDGTTTNATINQTGKLDRAYSFDANGDYVTLPDHADLQMNTSDFSIACWVNLTGGDASWRGIIGGEVGSFAMGTYGASPPILQIAKVDAAGSTASTLQVSTGSWHFICISFDTDATTNNAVLYVDGNTQTITFNNDYTTNASTNIIGGIKSNTNLWYGLIDEVGIWKRSLTPTEVASLYNSGNAFPYPFGGSHLGYKLYDNGQINFIYFNGSKYWAY
jgi:hypothetical protein